MSKRFKIITQYTNGNAGVTSFDTYKEASSAYSKQIELVTWFYEASSVRLIDTKQQDGDCEHVLHLCTTSKSF